MAQPTLVISIGTTGLAIMEQAQQYIYEYTGQTSPQQTKFLFLETDRNRKAVSLPNGKTDIMSCNLQFDNVPLMLRKWNETKKWNWLPQNADILCQGLGAGGSPTFGRVALWANYDAVSEVISTAYGQVQGGPETNIYIVGTLTGGTGSGMLVDIAYMVRQITKNSNIFGLFLLPKSNDVGSAKEQNKYDNAYNSIRALNRYISVNKETGKNYECTLPGGTKLDSLFAPYTKIQFLSADFSNANASLSGVDSLVRSAGMALTLKLLKDEKGDSPLQSKILSRAVDQDSQLKVLPYMTVGMHIFQYPEAMMQEYFAASLGETEVLQRWNDTAFFINRTGVKMPIDNLKNNQIPAETSAFVEKAIENAIEANQGLAILGANNLQQSLKQKVDEITTGSYKNTAATKVDYVANLFNPNASANYFAVIKGFEMNLRNAFIEQLHDFIEKKSVEYKNVHVVKLYLQGVENAINHLLQDWQSRLKIDGQQTQLSNTLGNLITTETKGATELGYSLYTCKQDYWFELLLNLANICYYNTFVPMLRDILRNIQEASESDTIRTPENVLLPTYRMCNEVTSKLNDLLNDEKTESVVKRKCILGGQLNDNKHPQFHYLFNTSFDGDISQMQSNYTNGKKYDFAAMSWDYLLERGVVAIKDELIYDALAFVKASNLLPKNGNTPVDVVSLIVREAGNAQHPWQPILEALLRTGQFNIQQKTPAMVSLAGDMVFDFKNSKLNMQVIAPYDEKEGIVMKMEGYKPSSNNDTYVKLTSLKNTVVLYQECGYMVDGSAFNPEIHLAYQEQVKESIEQRKSRGDYNQVMKEAYFANV